MVRDVPCLVVGGGSVAARKVSELLKCEAAVTVVAPEAHEAMGILSRQGAISAIEREPLRVELREYQEGEAARFRLVISATGKPEVDAKVYEDARRAGVWINSADDLEHCTFLLPAVIRQGRVVASVSTSGSSPALSVWLRNRIAQTLGPRIDDLAAMLEAARDELKAAERSTDSLDWSGLLEGPLPRLVTEGRTAEARALIEAAISEAIEPSGDPSGPDHRQ